MGGTPDVRVRLSAEGELSIINAFKRIQAQADQTGRIGARGLGALTTAGLNLGRILPGLSFAAAIAGAGYLAKQALTTGDQFAKLSQRTGASIETLSAYAHGAEISGIDTEVLAKGLARLSKNMGLAAQGGQLQVAAFERVGISQKDLQSGSITLDQALLKISGRLSQLPDGWQKSAEAQALFGRSGDRLIPFLDKGPAGLAAMRAEAEKLALVWSTQDALAAQEFENQLKNLRGTVQGFTNRELTALLPLLNVLASSLLDISKHADKAGISLGQRFALGILTGGAAIRAVGGMIKDFTTKGGFAGLITGDVSFTENLKKEMATVEEIIFQTRGGAGGGAPPPPKIKPEAPIVDEAARTRAVNAAKQLANARLALHRAELDSELALLQANNKLMEAAEADRFKQGQIAVEAYFSGRREALDQEAMSEIGILDREVFEIQARIREAETRPLAKGEPPAVRQAEVAKLQADFAKAQGEADLRALKAASDHAALTREERDEVRKLSVEQLNADAQHWTNQNQSFAAAMTELEAQLAGMERLKGEEAAVFAARQNAAREAGQARIAFEEIQAQARTAFAQIESSRIGIEALVQRGIISEYDGAQRIADLEKERLPELQAIAAAMAAAAVTPEQIETARQFTDQLKQLAASADLAGQRMAEFKKAVTDALTNDLANWMARGIDDAKSLGDAIRGLALSIVESMRQIAAQAIAKKIIDSIMGFFGGGGGEFALAGATGGLVRGPGTSTSDSIPAWLSDGEFVVREAAVRRVGVQFLDDLNTFNTLHLRTPGRVRNFAAGGLVQSGEARSTRPSRADLGIALDDVLYLKRVSATSDWGRIFIRTTQENRKSINAALGRG